VLFGVIGVNAFFSGKAFSPFSSESCHLLPTSFRPTLCTRKFSHFKANCVYGLLSLVVSAMVCSDKADHTYHPCVFPYFVTRASIGQMSAGTYGLCWRGVKRFMCGQVTRNRRFFLSLMHFLLCYIARLFLEVGKAKDIKHLCFCYEVYKNRSVGNDVIHNLVIYIISSKVKI